MKSEARKRAVLKYGECGLELFAQNVPARNFLALAEFDLAYLESLALLADDSLRPAITLAHRLLEVLAALDDSHHTRLLHFTVKAAQ